MADLSEVVRIVDGEEYVWFFGSKELHTSKLIKAAPGTEIIGENTGGAAAACFFTGTGSVATPARNARLPQN
ncbi:MAG: hypothetical protein ACPGSH_05175, partial [Ilumatobacteraceae bacterium]